MGTSANRRGISPATPLLPDWLDEVDDEDAANLDQDSDELDPATDSDGGNPPVDNLPSEADDAEPTVSGNRFDSSQRGFREAVRTGSNSGLNRAVKNYFDRALGGSKRAARRMQSSSRAVARLGNILSDIQQQGINSVLAQYNLTQYVGRPVAAILSALMDIVCENSSLLDNAITKYAYAKAIVRVIDENSNLDLNKLNEKQVASMMATFLEESLVYRLICDVGRSLTVATSDPARAVQAEEQIRQIVSGFIRSLIIPELEKAVQDKSTIERQIHRIYRIAIQTILDS